MSYTKEQVKEYQEKNKEKISKRMKLYNEKKQRKDSKLQKGILYKK